MIHIGLAGWGDHDKLYGTGVRAADKLKTYSEHFPVVEVDSSYYAIPKREHFAKWCLDTPSEFGFLVKAYQGMTGQLRGPLPYPDEASMYNALFAAIEPIREAGKLRALLFQYPPWFDCTKAHVELLRRTKARLGDLPAALEFRHRSWFGAQVEDRTIAFMEQEGWIHSICDEPDAGSGSIPTIARVTDPKLTVVRFHGRNRDGWNSGGKGDWRAVRYLYRYNSSELAEWRDQLLELERATVQLVVIFNNNSGGDAADNAKQLMRMLGMSVKEEPPEQLEWF